MSERYVEYTDGWDAYSEREDDGVVIEYKKNGQLHNDENEPAIIYHDGTLGFYKEGLLHNENGPARYYPDGTMEWWQNGKQHREGGPAVIYPNGKMEWWLNDQQTK